MNKKTKDHKLLKAEPFMGSLGLLATRDIGFVTYRAIKERHTILVKKEREEPAR